MFDVEDLAYFIVFCVLVGMVCLGVFAYSLEPAEALHNYTSEECRVLPKTKKEVCFDRKKRYEK